MPKCPKCGKDAKALRMTGDYQYSPAPGQYLCQACHEKVSSAHNIVIGLAVLLVLAWLGAIFMLAPAEPPVFTDETFPIFLFSGIFGIPIFIVILNKALGG